jgi:hypothetical protein
VQLETIEPVHAAFAALSEAGKDLVRGNAAVMTDPNRQAVHELNASGLPLAGWQIGTQRKQGHRNQFDKARVAGQTGKLGSFARQHRPEIKVLKRAVVRSVKPNQEGHHLA